jgi:hypothetical protein
VGAAARLVTVGLYRHSRNPMYVAVLITLAGWAVLFGAARLWGYAAAVAAAFQLRVVYGEEPWLARRHAEDWAAYRARVPGGSRGPAGASGAVAPRADESSQPPSARIVPDRIPISNPARSHAEPELGGAQLFTCSR